MYSSKDLERLWFLYKTEGKPKGISINSFCMSNKLEFDCICKLNSPFLIQ